MIRLFYYVSIILFCISSDLSIADTKPNGCGTEKFGWLVPDSTLLSNCTFKAACNNHDLCYGRCLPGGDLYGQQTCSDDSARKDRRKKCDHNFKIDLVSDNDERPICNLYASIYAWAVKTFGEENFFGVDNQQPEHIKEFNRFLEYAEANPNVFDLIKIEKDISEIQNQESSNIIVKFDANSPELRIISISNDSWKELLVIKGEKK